MPGEGPWAAASDPPALAVRGLTCRRRDGSAILRRVDLEVGAGGMVAVVGGNGAGKTTLLDVVSGLRRPDEGTVQVLGHPPREAARRGLVAVMLQQGGLLPDLRVREAVELFLELHGQARAGVRQQADRLLAESRLSAVSDQRIGTCSGGEQQRLRWAIARAGDPAVLVLDEPTAAMDWRGRREFWELVRSVREAGCTVLYASHHADEIEHTADRVLLLEQGRIVLDADPATVRDSAGPQAPWFEGLVRLVGAGVPAAGEQR